MIDAFLQGHYIKSLLFNSKGIVGKGMTEPHSIANHHHFKYTTQHHQQQQQTLSPIITYYHTFTFSLQSRVRPTTPKARAWINKTVSSFKQICIYIGGGQTETAVPHLFTTKNLQATPTFFWYMENLRRPARQADI